MPRTEPMVMALVSEDLTDPIDEGVKRYAYELGRALAAFGRVSPFNVPRALAPGGVAETAPSDRLFLGGPLIRRLVALRPDEVYYVPSPSATPATLLRARMLRRHLPDARIGVVALLPRRYPPWLVRFLPRLAPHVLYVLSPRSRSRMEGLGFSVSLLPAGVDLERFVPAGPGEKARLRRAYGVPVDRPLLLHVGHLKPTRSPATLARVARETPFTPLFVASTSTEESPGVRAQLEAAGCLVLRRYFERVEELYRMADLYFFPVEHPNACIEFPLSVLEALASGVPVLARAFGGLSHFLPEGTGVRYFRDETEAAALLRAPPGTWEPPGDLVRSFTWNRVAEEAVRALRRTRDPGGGAA